MKNNYCIIMAGGVGSRFWPMSRTDHPKQFIDILGTGTSLLRQTYERFLHVCLPENIYVVTNALYNDLVLKQIPEMSPGQVVLEPARRNTAPCVAYAAYKIKAINPHARLVVAPSDHIILKEDIFVEKVNTALRAAGENDWLITLGIKPSRPDTGYGYIQFNNDSGDERYDGLKKVKTFTEKPNLELAEAFLKSGDFVWNSGIFIWSLKSILKAFEEHLPEMNNLFREGIGKYNTPQESEFIRDTYTVCKAISIDYGVMEKASNVYVLESDFGWSDLGTWGSLYDIRKKDEKGNATFGKNVLFFNTENCIVHMPADKLVAIQGLDGYIVVEDDNILLICRMEDEQHIRQIVTDVRIVKGEKFI